jgi:hypothetical protein
MIRPVLRLWMLPVMISLLSFLPACGDDDGPPPTGLQNTSPSPSPSPEPEPFMEDSLVFGTGTLMGDELLTCCGLYDPGFVNEPAIQVMLYDPAGQKDAWSIILLTEVATAGTVYTLPIDNVAPHRIPAVLLFVHRGEYSSEPEEASGTITLHSFACGATTTSVDFSVDATLQSEYHDGGQITVKGRFRAAFPKNPCTP